MKDINIELAIVIFAFGLFGMYVHWRIAKRDGRAMGTFYDYLFADNTKGSGITLFAFISSIGGLFAIGSFDAVRLDATWEALTNGFIYAPMAQAIVLSVTTGYACDSMLNGSK